MREHSYRGWRAPAGSQGVKVAALLLAAGTIGAVVAAACTSSAPAEQLGAHVVLSCLADGVACKHDNQCCGANCYAGACIPRSPGCVEDNYACASASDCCTGDCDPDGFCNLPSCQADDAGCSADRQCCSSKCQGGFCAAPPDGGACVEYYDPCVANADCCSVTCLNGFCEPVDAGARCMDDLITCGSNADCCSSYCNASTTTCGFPPNAGACGTNGSACSKNADCCSSVCNMTEGICDSYPCVADGKACKVEQGDAPCCDGFACTQGTCAQCLHIGKPCQLNIDCCSLTCSHGSCVRSQ